MALDTDVQEFSSPLRKLAPFFQSSRDKWKRKCLVAKQHLKRLKTQVRAVERSRHHWKQAVREQRRRIAELESQLKKSR